MGRVIKTITLFLFTLYSGCLLAQYETVFKTPFPRQYRLVDSIIGSITFGDSTNASIILQRLGEAAKQSNNEQNLLNFRRSVLKYKNASLYNSHDTAVLNTLLRDELSLLEIIDEKKYPELAAMVNVIVGKTAFHKTHSYTLAFEHFIKAYNLFKNLSKEHYPDWHYAQYDIAMEYYQFNDFKNALRLGKEIESTYPEKNYVSIFNTDMIGMCYLRMGQYDSAITNFRWVIDNSQYSGNRRAWEGIASGNIGNAYFSQDLYDNALPYLEQGVNLTIEENIPDNTADFASWASIIYTKQKDTAIAKKYLEIAQQSAWKARSASNYYNVYKAVADFYKETGNSNLALLYTDSAIIYKDSLAKILATSLKYHVEIAVEAEHKQQEEKLFEEQSTRLQLTRNGLIIVIVLVMIIALLIYNRIRIKNKYRKDQLPEENNPPAQN